MTGATGKIGSRLVRRLILWGYKVRALVRKPDSSLSLGDSNIELAIGDLLDPESLKEAVKNVDAVIHLATHYKDASEEQSRMANIEGTEILAKSSIAAGMKNFIFASSNRVYGSYRGKLVAEDDPTRPLENKFAIAKVESETLLLQLFKDCNSILCILRFSLVYGDGDPHLKETVAFLNDWQPSKRVQMVHHADIAQAVKLSINQNAKGIYNVTDDAPITISELRNIYGLADTSEGYVRDPGWH